MGRQLSLYLSPNPPPHQASCKTLGRKSSGHSSREPLCMAPASEQSTHSGPECSLGSRCSPHQTDGLAHLSKLRARINCILLNSHKASTRSSYSRKLSRLLSFPTASETSTTSATRWTFLHSCFPLWMWGLHTHPLTSIWQPSRHYTREWMATQCSPTGHQSSFGGMIRMYPILAHLTLPWDPAIVLQGLTRRLFEPMASCVPHLLTRKTAFLVAVTSATRVRELRALRHNPPNLIFHVESATLFLNITFLPKVVSVFHLHASVHLPTFFPNPASLEDRHACPQSLSVLPGSNGGGGRKDPNLFVSSAEP